MHFGKRTKGHKSNLSPNTPHSQFTAMAVSKHLFRGPTEGEVKAMRHDLTLAERYGMEGEALQGVREAFKKAMTEALTPRHLRLNARPGPVGLSVDVKP